MSKEGSSDHDRIKTGERAHQVSNGIGQFVQVVELAAAALFALLFGIGVIDLAYQIALTVPTGGITDPLVVIGFIETGLLLLIIVEVYQTVVAYVKQNETRQIVRLVIYTGVIAMVRKVIIFRTSEYPSVNDALLAAIAYTVIMLGLVSLLFVERKLSTADISLD
ncbi:MAG: phosphate-starvation-inducible PsiE family protein [Halodesulfurarchaeum sp.]|nr:phosphate-starvation-inducible PsiE family protein [Halodesulfurarchaeum sp.]